MSVRIYSDNRHRKTEKEEDEELLGKGEDEEDDGVMVFEESPPCEVTTFPRCS